MMNGNGGPRPLSRKKTVRLLVALTILAWATQTLMLQWGFGAEPPRRGLGEPPATGPTHERVAQERFVPGTERFAAGATIELRAEATVVGEEFRLRQVARWSQQDEAVLAPVAELILVRVGPGAPFRAISLAEVKDTLQSAGINIAALNFVGASSCTVNRSDVEYDEQTALQQWIDAKEAITAAAVPTTAPAREEEAAPAPATSVVASDRQDVRTLRQRLVADLAQRLNLPAESLQVDFKTQDARTLALAEPMFRFEVEPMRVKNLGEVSWLVLIVADGQAQKAVISADARAWQAQLVVAKPLAMKQMIREDDLVERKTLVERLPDEPLLARAEAVGQQAARPLAAGTVLTSRAVEAVQLVKAGQFVTITLEQGGIKIKSVAKALESGAYGQTIRVKNESTKDVFQVILTGPQVATMNLSAPTRTAPSNLASAGD